ncbi:hypothetical protein WK13_34710 [Burkholderia ubonensis]|uniref:hypothetical protein n=1 Tax=Burkholderia ubonensis TaxID=101571 RepID=UPI000759F24B|nr:hypothetical protein [Burkholderia ubonensis]KVR21692.1 hypothetical protein WK13_34710 [Burkholderia ubonensis]
MALTLRMKPAGYLLESPVAKPDIRLELSDTERQNAEAAGYTIHNLFKGSPTAVAAAVDAWRSPKDSKPLHDGGPRRRGVHVWAIYHSHFSRKLRVGEVEYHRVHGWRPIDADDWDYQVLLWQPLPEIPLSLKLRHARSLAEEKREKEKPTPPSDQML